MNSKYKLNRIYFNFTNFAMIASAMRSMDCLRYVVERGAPLRGSIIHNACVVYSPIGEERWKKRGRGGGREEKEWRREGREEKREEGEEWKEREERRRGRGGRRRGEERKWRGREEVPQEKRGS
jgi:hypothetical protein